MTSRFLIALLIVGALALACGPLARSNDARQDTPPQVDRNDANDDKPFATSLNVSVSADVKLGLHVTNRSERRLEVTFPSGQTYDFVVLDSIGREVWRWSQGRMFTQSIQNRFVGSRETLSYEERWDGSSQAGTFTAVAMLTSSNHPVEERVTFTLP